MTDLPCLIQTLMFWKQIMYFLDRNCRGGSIKQGVKGSSEWKVFLLKMLREKTLFQQKSQSVNDLMTYDNRFFAISNPFNCYNNIVIRRDFVFPL